MKVLVVGSGGREHALAWSLAKDPSVEKVYAAPGNPGIAEVAKCVQISPTEIKQLLTLAKEEKIDLTIVGPEAPLARGIVDAFQENDLRIFGPSRSAARIETSKSFAKNLCSQFHIPTPKWEAFTSQVDAERALNRFGPPWVVKADGLAAGKGTTVTQDRREAEAAVERELKREPGRVVLEEFVDGWEATFMATVSSGRVQWLMPIFQDYKPAYDGDVGPNTGGMGCFSPVPAITPSFVERVKTTILTPTINAMEKSGVHYQGVLNLNAIVRKNSEDPYVLEFNARFGDPEAQGAMVLTKSGLAEHLHSVADDSQNPPTPERRESACVLVVIASRGYPASQSIGDKITIRSIQSENLMVFQAGTARSPAGELVTAGGRVLNVVATGENVETARKDAYETIKNSISFPGMHYRADIGAAKGRQRNLQVQTK